MRLFLQALIVANIIFTIYAVGTTLYLAIGLPPDTSIKISHWEYVGRDIAILLQTMFLVCGVFLYIIHHVIDQENTKQAGY